MNEERKHPLKWLEQFEKPSLYVDTRTFRIPIAELEKMVKQEDKKKAVDWRENNPLFARDIFWNVKG